MKEVVSAFGSDVLRPLVSLVVPGTIAALPASVALLLTHSALLSLVASNRTEAIEAFVLIVLFLGLLCENLGSHLEYTFDKRIEDADAHRQNWFAYLRIAYKVEPVGHHYLRTLVIRLKFELGSFAAFGIALFGIWWLPTTFWNRGLLSIVPTIMLLVFYFESQWTHAILSNLRDELLKGVEEWPPSASETRAAKGGQ
jgi:hypothetical protein